MSLSNASIFKKQLGLRKQSEDERENDWVRVLPETVEAYNSDFNKGLKLNQPLETGDGKPIYYRFNATE